jgi:hypothetical protein
MDRWEAELWVGIHSSQETGLAPGRMCGRVLRCAATALLPS